MSTSYDVVLARSSGLYTNTACHRCKAPKEARTPTTYCAACAALPVCEDCGEVVADCDRDNRYEGAAGCSDDYGCFGAWDRNHDADYEGTADSRAAARTEWQHYS